MKIEATLSILHADGTVFQTLNNELLKTFFVENFGGNRVEQIKHISSKTGLGLYESKKVSDWLLERGL